MVVHLELVEQTREALELRLWHENPNERQVRTLALEGVAALVRMAEADYYSPLPARLVEYGRRLFKWLDGGERWLGRELEEARNTDQELVLAIAMPNGLAHLPWEVLHDGTDFLVHRVNPAVLPVRWRPARRGTHASANRPLQALFMAASPENVRPVLDFEAEEAAILDATARRRLELTVEESGSLQELKGLVLDHGETFFDVLHLTGHASHDEQGRPVFVLEDQTGKAANAMARDLARAIPHPMPLVFLSGCRTGQNPAHAEVRSLAEQLVEVGFRSVLGWGRPVLDSEATLVARHLYERLAAGETLARALLHTHTQMLQAGARDWHLLRLFCAGEPPGALVTPLRTPGRKHNLSRPVEMEFLDPLTRTVKVATRSSFVGRRRLLQRSLKLLRLPGAGRVGLLLHGQGGRGKSSVAARLCDRLGGLYGRVVVIGRLDESSLTNAWAAEISDPGQVQALREPGLELRFRIERLLRSLADGGGRQPLFVLDDFEQNQPGQERGDLTLAAEAATVLEALVGALEHAGFGRLLMTCRYELMAPFGRALALEGVPPLDENERKKQALRLDQRSSRLVRERGLMEQAMAAADGNPRLFEWLHCVLEQPGLDHARIVAEMHAAEERFREEILARHLIGKLPREGRTLLGRMLLLAVPVPMEVVVSLYPEILAREIQTLLEQACSYGLVDITEEDGKPHYRVPRQLGEGERPLLGAPQQSERAVLAERAFEILFPFWYTQGGGTNEAQILELIGLATACTRKRELVELANSVTSRWLSQHRYGQTQQVLESIIGATDNHHTLLVNLARAVRMLGDGERAGSLLRQAAESCPKGAEKDRGDILFHYADWLAGRGELEEALRIWRSELLPLCERLGDVRSHAVALGKIADVLAARGQLREALRIRKEEELPVYERLGDMRERAVTLGKIADVLGAHGELEEALRIRKEEELPVYERLGDVRSRAVTMGKIADVLATRGELEEALRIRKEEQLPVYERLGDVRLRAVTLGKIADVLAAHGELEEALRIRKEEELPVYERLGDVRSRAVTLGKIADVLRARGELEEALRIHKEEELPVYERLGDVRARAMTLGKIADVLVARGELEEALPILKQEVLPVFERLGDVRSRAVTVGKIADVLAARGELEEALRIRKEEQLPVYERLGDVRARAMTLGQIADMLAERGELEEALRIRNAEELPVYARLGDVRALLVARTKIALLLLRRSQAEDSRQALEHLIWAHRAARQGGYKEAGQIAEILKKLGVEPRE